MHKTPVQTAGLDQSVITAEGARVLIADDVQMLAESLSRLLGRRGFQVIGIARDGHEAVTLATKHQPQIVVMDVRMPRMDGLEATRIIKQLHPHIRIIILSAYDDPALRAEALAAGASRYVVKGTSPREVVAQIQETVYDVTRCAP